MTDTKELIFNTAIQLFNSLGVNNVTLRTIANKVGISPGNLAYHYKNKQLIIEDAFKRMQVERTSILTGVQEIPSIEKIYDQMVPMYLLEKKYLFLNLDAIHIIRNHPEFAQLQRDHIEKKIDYIRAVLDLSIATGNMYPEKTEGEYDRIAQSQWLIMYFWLTQKEIRGIDSDNIEELQQSVWDLALPKMTEKGLYKYSKLFNRKGINLKVKQKIARTEQRSESRK